MMLKPLPIDLAEALEMQRHFNVAICAWAKDHALLKAWFVDQSSDVEYRTYVTLGLIDDVTILALASAGVEDRRGAPS
jgi:hypothetical protein